MVMEEVAHGLGMGMSCLTRDRERGQRGYRATRGDVRHAEEGKGKQNWSTCYRNLQYGHKFDHCLQAVRQIGRKKLLFEFCQNKIWVRCPKYMESPSSICFQKENVFLSAI